MLRKSNTCFIFYFFAYAAHFMFGTEFEEFATVRGSVYTQFRMLTGDFPFPTHTLDRDTIFFIYYLVLFFLVVFMMLLNFLLAVIIDAYTTVVAATIECDIEHTVFEDVFYSFSYLRHRIGRKHWPSRSAVALAIATIDIDNNEQSDVFERGLNVPLPIGVLTKLRTPFSNRLLFSDETTAREWVLYYIDVCPPLSFFYQKPDESVFVFQKEGRNMAKVAWLRRDERTKEMSAILRSILEKKTVEQYAEEMAKAENMRRKSIEIGQQLLDQ